MSQEGEVCLQVLLALMAEFFAGGHRRAQQRPRGRKNASPGGCRRRLEEVMQAAAHSWCRDLLIKAESGHRLALCASCGNSQAEGCMGWPLAATGAHCNGNLSSAAYSRARQRPAWRRPQPRLGVGGGDPPPPLPAFERKPSAEPRAEQPK